MPPHPFTSFEMQKHYQGELKVKSIYSQNNLPNTIKDGAYIINPTECKSKRTYWIDFYPTGDSLTYIDCFGVQLF